MVLVDTSVWIDYFNGVDTLESAVLETLLGSEPVAVGDLILTEVLQGFRSDADYEAASRLLGDLTSFDLLGKEMSIKAAANYRALRSRGITVRKTADTIIATFCIERRMPLLYSDRDFDPFVRHLGLISASN